MNVAKLDKNNIVLDVILATVDEAKNTFGGTWVECPPWIGIGMNINTPKPDGFVPFSSSPKRNK